MALINILINSLKGEIAHMNSLSNEFHVGYQVLTTLIDGYHIPYYVEFIEPELSQIWLHPLKVKEGSSSFKTSFNPVNISSTMNGVQGSLF